MGSKAPNLRWGIEQRLEFIEFRLYWEGGINRSEIIDFFGVSVPQASKDLSQYQELAPENMVYDRSQKRYFPATGFKPRFLKPDATRYLTQLHSIGRDVLDESETWLSHIPDFEVVPLPRRNIDPEIFRNILRAVRNNQAIEIKYQSLSPNRPKPVWRWITPHAFGFDGMRWHSRAFCHIDEQFKDFLLPRILDTRAEDESKADPSDDFTWNEITTIILKPHPGLTEDQQKAIALDFGMQDKQIQLRVRLAMLYYLLRRLGLDSKEHERDAREQHIVLADPEAVFSALEKAQYR